MNTESIIIEKLENALNTRFLEVLNESHMHNVPKNAETHFKVTIVSDDFEDTRAVARHQKVYQILNSELNNGVHALAIHTFTASEWKDRGESPDSPKCRGGE